MLKILIDSIFVMLVDVFFQQLVGIHIMGIKCVSSSSRQLVPLFVLNRCHAQNFQETL